MAPNWSRPSGAGRDAHYRGPVNLLALAPDPSDPRRVQLESGRTCDRLRSLSLARLSAPVPGGGTRAGMAAALAQEIVDATATVVAGPPRRLPTLPDSAVGDVLAVCVVDFVEAVTSHGALDEERVARLCAWATDRLVRLRASL